MKDSADQTKKSGFSERDYFEELTKKTEGYAFAAMFIEDGYLGPVSAADLLVHADAVETVKKSNLEAEEKQKLLTFLDLALIKKDKFSILYAISIVNKYLGTEREKEVYLRRKLIEAWLKGKTVDEFKKEEEQAIQSMPISDYEKLGVKEILNLIASNAKAFIPKAIIEEDATEEQVKTLWELTYKVLGLSFSRSNEQDRQKGDMLLPYVGGGMVRYKFWVVHTIEVTNAFLKGEISKEEFELEHKLMREVLRAWGKEKSMDEFKKDEQQRIESIPIDDPKKKELLALLDKVVERAKQQANSIERCVPTDEELKNHAEVVEKVKKSNLSAEGKERMLQFLELGLSTGHGFFVNYTANAVKGYIGERYPQEQLDFELRLLRAWCDDKIEEFLTNEIDKIIKSKKISEFECSKLKELADIALKRSKFLIAIAASNLRVYYPIQPQEERLKIIAHMIGVLKAANPPQEGAIF